MVPPQVVLPNSVGAPQLLAPPGEVYLPSFVMNSLPPGRVARALTYMDWSYGTPGGPKQKLLVTPRLVAAVRNGTWPGVFAVKRVDPANRALRRLINALDAPPAAGSSKNVSVDSLAAAAPVVNADVGASVEPAQHDSRSSAVPCTHANGCCKRHPKSCAAGRRTPPKGAEHRKGVEHRIK